MKAKVALHECECREGENRELAIEDATYVGRNLKCATEDDSEHLFNAQTKILHGMASSNSYRRRQI